MMKNMSIKTTEDLAKAIIDDIRYQNLRMGDRYLTAKEISEKFSVSTVTAHRAMVALSEQNVVIRKRKSGTFIGPGFVSNPDQDNDAIHVLHVFLDKAYSKNHPDVFNLFSDVSEDVLGDCTVQFHMVPERESLLFTRRLVSQISESDYNEAVVLIHSTEKVQRTIQEAGVQAVIFGSAFPGIEHSTLDLDQAKIGREIVQSLIDKKCKKILLFNYSSWRQGDNLLYNSISETMGQAGYSMGSLSIHQVSQDLVFNRDQILSEINAVEGPVGFICRDKLIAASLSGISYGTANEVFIGCCDICDKRQVYSSITPLIDYQKQIKALLKLFLNKDLKGINQKVDIRLTLKK